MSPSPAAETTRLLTQVSQGNPKAAEELMPLVYEDLKNVARAFMTHEKPGHTLQPTALVHEAFLRLVGQDRSVIQNREHFVSLASTAIRRILVDHVRAHDTQKRGKDQDRVPLVDIAIEEKKENVDLIALDSALHVLAKADPRKCRIVEMRFFGGLSIGEVATALKISKRAVDKDWQLAKAWLLATLQSSKDEEDRGDSHESLHGESSSS